MKILFRNKLVLDVTEEQGKNLAELLQGGSSKYFEIDGSLYNIADVSGVLRDEIYTKMKMDSGEVWQCSFKTWHKRMERCLCKYADGSLYRNGLSPKEFSKESGGLLEDGKPEQLRGGFKPL